MIALLLILALLAPALPAAAAPAPPVVGLQVVATGAALTAVWAPPAGQTRACAVRVAPLPAQLLEPCAEGPDAARLDLAVASDLALRVRPRDTVELRIYGPRYAPIAVGQAEVAPAWRLWLLNLAQ